MALADERWDFVLAEQSFGEANAGAACSWPPLSLESPDGERVLLRGRVDRLDVAHDGSALRIVDYKGRQNPASALGVTDLQLPLYAVAAFASLPRAPAAAHAAYVAYSTREKPRTEKQEETFHVHFARTLDPEEDGVRPVVRRALDILQNARRGSLLPTEGTPCARCEQDGACRKPRFSVPADEKEDD
jgi:hypothetical protein